MGKLNDALLGIREIDGAEADGELRALRALTPQVLEEARRMLTEVEQVLKVVQDLEALESHWVFGLRAKCRRSDFESEQQALKALLTEVDELVQARIALLQRPVALPSTLLSNPKVTQAIERASETGKPFGLMTFGNGDVKEQVAAIRVSGLAPQTADDWVHVHRYVLLHDAGARFRCDGASSRRGSRCLR